MAAQPTHASDSGMANAATAPSRVIVFTGGSSGIGLCSAMLFARRGWRVGLIARGEAGLDAAAGRVRGAGGMVATAAADVTDSAALAAAAASIAGQLGPPEVWVNAAGIAFIARLADMEEAEFRRVVDVTFMGQVNGTRAALALMAPRGRGTIVGIGSALAYRGIPLQTAYCAAKFALRGFYEALRGELRHDGVRVHIAMVHPPAVNTPFFSHAGARLPGGDSAENPRPPPPVYEPELIADAIWLAVAERRRDLKVSGTTVQMVWGNRLAPRTMDWLLGLVGYASQKPSRRDVADLRDASLFAAGTHETASVHGPFGRGARLSSTQMWLERNRVAVGISAIALLAALRPARRRRR